MPTLIPTRRLWVLVGCGVPIALAGSVVPGFERLLLPYNIALAGLFWISGRAAGKWDAVRVWRKVDPVFSVWQPNRVTVVVESRAPVPLKVRVRDEPPESSRVEGNEFEAVVKPGGRVEREYTLTPTERGAGVFRSTVVRFTAPFGLAIVQTTLDTKQDVAVYPNVRAVREFEFLKQRGRLRQAGQRVSRMKGLGTEFESLREYNDDDFRFIDWKSTARRGRLVVKNFEQERNQSVIVCVDLGRHMLGHVGEATKLDHALDAALLLFHAAERAGDLVGLYAFNDTVRSYIAPRRGRAQVAAVLEAVHALTADAVQPDYAKAFTYLSSRWKRRSLVVVFTDAENEDDALDLARALGPVRKHHLLMVVRVKDPRLKELLDMDVVDERSLAQRAAATWYQADRSIGAKALAAAGIATVEAEPQDLAAHLVSAYLRVKERALL